MKIIRTEIQLLMLIHKIITNMNLKIKIDFGLQQFI